jgi:hypothetical protein
MDHPSITYVGIIRTNSALKWSEVIEGCRNGHNRQADDRICVAEPAPQARHGSPDLHGRLGACPFCPVRHLLASGLSPIRHQDRSSVRTAPGMPYPCRDVRPVVSGESGAQSSLCACDIVAPACEAAGQDSPTLALVAQRIEHLTTDQKVGGSSPSERATVSAGRRPGHHSPGSSSSSSGRILAVPASVAAWRTSCRDAGSALLSCRLSRA